MLQRIQVLCLFSESQSVEECGNRLKRILESPSIPQVNHQLLVHLTGHLNRISQQSQAYPRVLGQAFTDIIFKHPSLRYRYKNCQHLQHFPLGNIHANRKAMLLSLSREPYVIIGNDLYLNCMFLKKTKKHCFA